MTIFNWSCFYYTIPYILSLSRLKSCYLIIKFPMKCVGKLVSVCRLVIKKLFNFSFLFVVVSTQASFDSFLVVIIEWSFWTRVIIINTLQIVYHVSYRSDSSIIYRCLLNTYQQLLLYFSILIWLGLNITRNKSWITRFDFIVIITLLFKIFLIAAIYFTICLLWANSMLV